MKDGPPVVPPWMLAAARHIAAVVALADGASLQLAEIIRQHCPDADHAAADVNAPHLEVRLRFLPLATARRPWVQQPPRHDARIWEHTGILFEKATLHTDAATPPKGFGFGLLQAYLDGRAIPMEAFEVELTRLGLTSESIEGLV